MSNLKNLTGQRFGRLVALERTAEKDAYGRCYLYRCLCDCGTICMVPTDQLKSGNVRSCGCMQRESRLRDISGQRFGRLVALRPTLQIINYSAEWLFQCDCGNLCTATVNDVVWSGKQSCGCLAAETKAAQAIKMQKRLPRVGGTDISKISSGTIARNNTSGIRGVQWHKGTGKWAAVIGFRGKKYTLGYFDEIEDAARARKDAETRLFGNFLDWYYAAHPDKRPK